MWRRKAGIEISHLPQIAQEPGIVPCSWKMLEEVWKKKQKDFVFRERAA